MAAVPLEYNYNDRVFINCPFDEAYLELFRAAIFTIYHCGFFPTTSLTEDNGLDNRIDKITRIIEGCRYGIHDISRTELNTSGFPRFNMPFELGLFYGARRFGCDDQRLKNALILESRRYSYMEYLSDISGVDIRAHEGKPYNIIQHIRNWLSSNSRRKDIPGAIVIWNNYQNFLNQLPDLSHNGGFQDLNQLPFSDFCDFVDRWLYLTAK